MVETALKNITALVIIVSVVGCASIRKTDSNDNATDQVSSEAQTARLTSDFSRSKLIAADFVATVTQFPSTTPGTTVLQTARPTTRFGELLLGALQSAGFDLRIGSEASDVWLNYAASLNEKTSESGNPIYTFVVGIGDVKLKRAYEVDQYGVWPAGNMFVRGADASNVVVDDSIFSNRRAPSQPIKQLPIEQPLTVAQSEPVPTVTLSAVPKPETLVRTKKVVAANPSQTSAQSASQSQSQTQLQSQSMVQKDMAESVAAMKPSQSTPAPAVPRESVASAPAGDYSEFSNIIDTGESRYKEIFANYSVLDSKVLVFPNDSLILGKNNKQSILKQLTDFNPETDIISVIGCSHGASNLENGNAYLANGRAFRVKEEYVSAGVDSEMVLEEGCWANENVAQLPDRGVIIQHKRRVN